MDTRSEQKIKFRHACGKCFRTFSTQSNLTVHERKIHSTDAWKTKFFCPECDKVFDYIKNWRAHYKNHHSKLNFAVKVAEKKVEAKRTPSKCKLSKKNVD